MDRKLSNKQIVDEVNTDMLLADDATLKQLKAMPRLKPRLGDLFCL